MVNSNSEINESAAPQRGSRLLWLAALLAVVAVVTFGVTALLVTIFEHRQEARTPFVRLVEVNEVTTDPVPWGTNWPLEFDSYRRTVDDVETEFGGSSAMPASKLEDASVAAAAVRRLRIQHRLSRGPRPRVHAVRSGSDGARHEAAAKRRLPALPRVDHSDVSPAGAGSEGRESRRRGAGGRFQLAGRDGGFRDRQRDGLPHGPCRACSRRRMARPAKARRCFPGGCEVDAASAPSRCRMRDHDASECASGWLHRLPRSGDDAECASRGPASSTASRRWRRATIPCRICRASSAGERAIASGRTIRTSTPAGRRCAASSAGSATSSTTAPRRKRCSFRGTTA